MKEYLKVRNNFVSTKNINVPFLFQKPILSKTSFIHNTKYVVNIKNDSNPKIPTSHISDTSTITTTRHQNKKFKNHKTNASFITYDTILSSIKESFMPLFGCSLSTLLKLLIILWLVGTLYQNEFLPQDTGPVLSKVTIHSHLQLIKLIIIQINS